MSKRRHGDQFIRHAEPESDRKWQSHRQQSVHEQLQEGRKGAERTQGAGKPPGAVE